MRILRLAGLVAVFFLGAAPMAQAQQTPSDIEVTIQKVLTQTAPLVATYKAQQEAAARAPKADPYASIKAQSAKLSSAQKADALSAFKSAYLLWKAGDFAAAELGFRRGLEADPANVPGNFYLGDILRRNGNQIDASKHFALAANLGGSEPESFQAQTALKELPPTPAVDPILDAAPVVWRVQGVGAIFHDCANCPDMIIVPAGVFTMGSPADEFGRKAYESPRRRIVIERPFAVGRFEITFAEWDACGAGRGCGGYRPKDEGWGRDTRPAINVSWDDAQQYVAWLSQTTQKSYRLLTEAEWEYTARAGTSTVYPWGESLGRYNAHCDACGTQTVEPQTQPVGAWGLNSFGLYSMLGNVWGWTQDCFASYSHGRPDGSAYVAESCARKAIRGGSWSSSNPLELRSANRGVEVQATRMDVIGFRVARTL